MVTEEKRIAHETLLKEIHVVDGLLETHANIMIVLMSGMLYFIFKMEAKEAQYILSAAGIAVSLEFFLHTYRLRDVAKSAKTRLAHIEKKEVGIDTSRGRTWLWKIPIPTGSTLILYLSLVFIGLWLMLIGLLCMNRI